MEKAIEKARSTFDTFKTRFKNPKKGDVAFALKVGITDENGTEHFWIQDIKIDGDKYGGKIGNDPGIVKNVQYGQNYEFGFEDISDWMFTDSKGVVIGGETIRVILLTMEPEKAKALKSQLGW